MIKSKLSVVLGLAMMTSIAQAQQEADTTNEAKDDSLNVPQTEWGECKTLVVEPARFEERTEQVIVKEPAETIEIIPAEYEWVEEQVLIKPAGERMEIIPATYKTIEEEIEVEPVVIEKEVIEPQFVEVTEEVLAKPDYMAAHNNKGVASGEVLRLTKVPAEHNNITKKVVQETVSIQETPIEAKYITIQKQVIDQPEEIKKVPYEAEYQTVRVKKLVKEAEEIRKEIPAEFANITVYDKVSDAQMHWETVLCENSVNEEVIKSVQRALNAKGYKAGTVDGALGPSTTKALEKYQSDEGIGVGGGVTMETLKSLGLQN